MAEAVAEKTHALLSPSGAHRWANCPGSVVLEEGKPNSTSKYARWGTCAHEVAGLVLEVAVVEGEWAPQNAKAFVGRTFQIDGFGIEFDMEMADCVNDYVAHVESFWSPGDVLLVEQGVPLEHITGEKGAEGTSDCIILKPDKREIVVIDLKGGMGEVVDAEENLQGLMYAAGAVEKHDLFYGPFERVTVVIIQPRVQHVSEWSIDWAEFEERVAFLRDAATNVGFAQNAYASMDHKNTSGPALDFSQWFNPDRKTCRWCKAKTECPALKGEVTTGLGRSAPADADDFPDLSLPKQASKALGGVADTGLDALAEAYRAAPLIEQWLEAVKSRVMLLLLEGSTVPGFALYEGRRGHRAWGEPDAVEKELKAAKVPVADVYDKKLASPTTLEKALKDRPKLWARVAGYIVQPDAKPQVGEAGDPERTPYVRVAEGDFPVLEDEVDPLS